MQPSSADEPTASNRRQRMTSHATALGADQCHRERAVLIQKSTILPQILGSLPEVIRSCCHHHHHHTLPKVFAERCTNARSRGALAFTSHGLNRPSRRVAGPGKRHSARGTPRAQPRDVRSAGRDTWNLTGEALGGPRKRSWRRCSRARSGRRSAIRGAHSGALDRPEPSDPAARAPIRTSAPYSAADASGSSCAARARLR